MAYVLTTYVWSTVIILRAISIRIVSHLGYDKFTTKTTTVGDCSRSVCLPYVVVVVLSCSLSDPCMRCSRQNVKFIEPHNIAYNKHNDHQSNEIKLLDAAATYCDTVISASRQMLPLGERRSRACWKYMNRTLQMLRGLAAEIKVKFASQRQAPHYPKIILILG